LGKMALQQRMRAGGTALQGGVSTLSSLVSAASRIVPGLVRTLAWVYALDGSAPVWEQAVPLLRDHIGRHSFLSAGARLLIMGMACRLLERRCPRLVYATVAKTPAQDGIFKFVASRALSVTLEPFLESLSFRLSFGTGVEHDYLSPIGEEPSAVQWYGHAKDWADTASKICEHSGQGHGRYLINVREDAHGASVDRRPTLPSARRPTLPSAPWPRPPRAVKSPIQSVISLLIHAFRLALFLLYMNESGILREVAGYALERMLRLCVLPAG